MGECVCGGGDPAELGIGQDSSPGSVFKVCLPSTKNTTLEKGASVTS